MNGPERFTLKIREDGKTIDERTLPDPFITTTLTLGRTPWERLKLAAEVLLHGKEFIINVGGERAAVGDVMVLLHSWEATPPTREGESVLMAGGA